MHATCSREHVLGWGSIRTGMHEECSPGFKYGRTHTHVLVHHGSFLFRRDDNSFAVVVKNF